jgi:nucleotide-binding universal stress UspA family protein
MKMLLATDGSECSIGAAQFLSQFRCSSDDEITVLYVIPEAPLSGAEESHYADLIRVKKGIAPKIETAGGRGVDLIVMGTYGKTGLKKLLMGSSTEKVIGHASCGVLVVRAAPPAREQCASAGANN